MISDFPQNGAEMDALLQRVARRACEQDAIYFDGIIEAARKNGSTPPDEATLATIRSGIVEGRTLLVDAVWQLINESDRTDYEGFRAEFQASLRELVHAEIRAFLRARDGIESGSNPAATSRHGPR